MVTTVPNGYLGLYILTDGNVRQRGVSVGLVNPMNIEVTPVVTEVVAGFSGAPTHAAMHPHFTGRNVFGTAGNLSLIHI